jgi:PAS domain S-box-containing protein
MIFPGLGRQESRNELIASISLIVMLLTTAAGSYPYRIPLSIAAAGGLALGLRKSLRNRRTCDLAQEERNDAVARERDARKRALTAEQGAIETLHSISDGLFVFDAGFKYIYVNPQGERLAGKLKADLAGNCIWDVAPELLGTEFERVYRRVMATREPETFETIHSVPDRWMEAGVFPNRYTGGLTVIFRDISDLKSARDASARLSQELRCANDLLEGIMEGSHDLIAVIDTGYRYIASNQAYRAAILGMTGCEIGRNTRVTELRFQYQLQARGAIDAWRLALQGRESSTSEELIVQGERRRTFQVHYAPIRDSAGKIAGASAVAHDVTELRAAERELTLTRGALNAQMPPTAEPPRKEPPRKEARLKKVHVA